MSLINPVRPPPPTHIRPNPSLRASQSARPPRWNDSMRPPPYEPRASHQRALLADQDAANLENAIERSLRPECDAELHFDDPPAYDEVDGTTQRKRKRRRRAVWCWLIGILFLLIVILGATLGTQLRNPTPWQHYATTERVLLRSGLATLVVDEQHHYLYYFAQNGSLMERLTDSESESSESRLVLAYPGVPKDGSAIAVTLADYDGKKKRQRHLFWLNSDNGITSVSAWLPDTLWSPPYNISLEQPAMPGSKALAACSSIQTSGEETTEVRLYYGTQESYGSEKGYVRELLAGFTRGRTPGWENITDFVGSDPMAGVACSGSDLFHVYTSQPSPRVLARRWHDESTSWNTEWWSPVDDQVADGSAVAAEGKGVFYQCANGSIAHAVPGNNLTHVEEYRAVEVARVKTALAADCRNDEGSCTVYFIDPDDENVVDYAETG